MLFLQHKTKKKRRRKNVYRRCVGSETADNHWAWSNSHTSVPSSLCVYGCLLLWGPIYIYNMMSFFPFMMTFINITILLPAILPVFVFV